MPRGRRFKCPAGSAGPMPAERPGQRIKRAKRRESRSTVAPAISGGCRPGEKGFLRGKVQPRRARRLSLARRISRGSALLYFLTVISHAPEWGAWATAALRWLSVYARAPGRGIFLCLYFSAFRARHCLFAARLAGRRRWRARGCTAL